VSNRSEFRYLRESAVGVQKKLNQWSRTYFITLHGMVLEADLCRVMVERRLKPETINE